MRPKYKVTGCARFFLFLVIFLPIVFFGAAYIRGENGVQIIKDYYHQVIGGKEKSDAKPETKNEAKEEDNSSKTDGRSDDTARYEIEVLKEELKKAQEEIVKLKAEIKALKEKE
jgi:cell division protein FtsB